MRFEVRAYKDDGDACRAVLDSLEPWFGIPAAVEEYLDGLSEEETLVATQRDRVIGFASLRAHFAESAEVEVIAVRRELRGSGVGRTLLARLEERCRGRGIQFLQVKTLSEDRESEEYAETRGFWRAVGFRPIETFPDLWDPSNPALQLIKVVPQQTAKSLIESLQLVPHPEGGYFRETWRSEREVDLDDYPSSRSMGTSILFLLPRGEESRWHRVRSDELWFWQGGDPLELVVRDETTRRSILSAVSPQAIVPAGAWQRAVPCAGSGVHGYSLVGCVVVPGFDFEDFELSDPPSE